MNSVDATELWQITKTSMQSAASTVLKQPHVPLTPRRMQARNNYLRAQKRLRTDPSNTRIQHEFTIAKKTRLTANETHVDEERYKLKVYCKGEQPPTMSTKDYHPLTPPPTIEQIDDIIRHMKAGNSPGLDKINFELLQHSAPELL